MESQITCFSRSGNAAVGPTSPHLQFLPFFHKSEVKGRALIVVRMRSKLRVIQHSAASAQRSRPPRFDGSTLPLSHHQLHIHSFKWQFVGCTFFTLMLIVCFHLRPNLLYWWESLVGLVGPVGYVGSCFPNTWCQLMPPVLLSTLPFAISVSVFCCKSNLFSTSMVAIATSRENVGIYAHWGCAGKS